MALAYAMRLTTSPRNVGLNRTRDNTNCCSESRCFLCTIHVFYGCKVPRVTRLNSTYIRKLPFFKKKTRTTTQLGLRVKIFFGLPFPLRSLFQVLCESGSAGL